MCLSSELGGLGEHPPVTCQPFPTGSVTRSRSLAEPSLASISPCAPLPVGKLPPPPTFVYKAICRAQCQSAPPAISVLRGWSLMLVDSTSYTNHGA